MNQRQTSRLSNGSSFRSAGGAENVTLLIFGGLVVLCSIFFVLGMVVGRSQVSATDPPLADAGESEEESNGLTEDLTFYDSVGQENPQGLSAPTAPSPDSLTVAEDTGGEVLPTLIFLQVAALSSADQANRLLDELLDEGFPAFLVRPEPSDDPRLYRVRVGPFATEEAASLARGALEDEGFNPIVPR